MPSSKHRRPDVHLRWVSALATDPATLWAWITSVHGISTELWPLLRMTTPAGVRTLVDLPVVPGLPGVPLFRSYLLLGGVLPVDCSQLTLTAIHPGQGFVEQSPIASMALWRHERRVVMPHAEPHIQGMQGMPSSQKTMPLLLTDDLLFRPRCARWLVTALVRQLFDHRHRVLQRQFNGMPYRLPTVPVD